ncbi:MAG: hypothetical protein FJZ01_15285, partial [Candidatus Sericytochromatia bacterium]|nr:hypothetical protein [Candidatus Tanganyikabacteria bacterium]
AARERAAIDSEGLLALRPASRADGSGTKPVAPVAIGSPAAAVPPASARPAGFSPAAASAARSGARSASVLLETAGALRARPASEPAASAANKARIPGTSKFRQSPVPGAGGFAVALPAHASRGTQSARGSVQPEAVSRKTFGPLGGVLEAFARLWPMFFPPTGARLS